MDSCVERRNFRQSVFEERYFTNPRDCHCLILDWYLAMNYSVMILTQRINYRKTLSLMICQANKCVKWLTMNYVNPRYSEECSWKSDREEPATGKISGNLRE